jgi:alkylation response protein AidB-like acyl-CoA dehydrogenase
MILSESQEMIRDAVRRFAREEIAPHAKEWEDAAAYPPDLFPRLAEIGLMGMTAPAAHGGAEADYVSYALAIMEIAAADGGLSTIVSVQNSLVIGAIRDEGTDAQKARFLPGLAAGTTIGAFALTEAGAGSDASAIKTRAKRVKDGYQLFGTKQFISSGKLAGLALVFAVTDPEKKRKGLSAFLVPTDRKGYSVTRIEKKLGQTASDTCALTFDDLFLEEDLRLGAEGEGYRVALAHLEEGRIGIGAQAVGMADAALEIAIRYARERTTFGKPIMEHQAVGHRLADLAAKLEAARQLVLHAASLKDAKRPCLREASMAKLVASETAEEVVTGAIQTLGGYGYLEDFALAKIYRDVRVCQIYEGTSDIQRMVIARSLSMDSP